MIDSRFLSVVFTSHCSGKLAKCLGFLPPAPLVATVSPMLQTEVGDRVSAMRPSQTVAPTGTAQ